MNEIAINILRFIFLVVLQVLILNNVLVNGYINPFLYILFILMLPIPTPKWLVLILSFLTGLIIDVFSDTGGLHTSASLIMAFFRSPVLRLFSPRDGYEKGQSPTLRQFGFRWLFSYAGILTLVHHFVLFFMETFRFYDFFFTLTKVFLSASFTLLLVFISQFFVDAPKKEMK